MECYKKRCWSLLLQQRYEWVPSATAEPCCLAQSAGWHATNVVLGLTAPCTGTSMYVSSPSRFDVKSRSSPAMLCTSLRCSHRGPSPTSLQQPHVLALSAPSACKGAKCCTSTHSAPNIRQVQGTSQAHTGTHRRLDQDTAAPQTIRCITLSQNNPKRTQEATRQLAWAPAQRRRAHGFWRLLPSCPAGPGRLCSSQSTPPGHQHLQQQCQKSSGQCRS